jgi:hypothetical protein
MGDGSTCRECGGTGTVEVDGKLRECVCEFLRRVAASMPPYIRRAEVMRGHAELPLIDAVNRSLFIVSAWQDMRAVLKAIWIKHSKLHIRITSDREIRDVYVGSTSRAAKGADSEEPVLNNLQDLMDAPDLVAIRLNELSYKNKAAPGALQEAFSYRLDRDKATWVVSDVARPFTRGSHAWSESVSDLFNSTLRKFVVPRIAPEIVLEDVLFVEPVQSRQIGNASPRPPRALPAPFEEEGSRGGSRPEEGAGGPKEEPEEPLERRIQSVPDDDGIPAALQGIGGGLGGGRGKFRRGR